MPASLENSVVDTRRKRSVFIPIPKKGNAKEYTNYCTIELISDTSKEMCKILQARLQQNLKQKFPDVKLDLEKAEEPNIKLTTFTESWRKQGRSRKNVCFTDYVEGL